MSAPAPTSLSPTLPEMIAAAVATIWSRTATKSHGSPQAARRFPHHGAELAHHPTLVPASRGLRPGTARTSPNLKMQQVTGPSYVLTPLPSSDL
jgi:hypothetical protein